jgi:hypothetical protein
MKGHFLYTILASRGTAGSRSMAGAGTSLFSGVERNRCGQNQRISSLVEIRWLEVGFEASSSKPSVQPTNLFSPDNKARIHQLTSRFCCTPRSHPVPPCRFMSSAKGAIWPEPVCYGGGQQHQNAQRIASITGQVQALVKAGSSALSVSWMSN